MFRFDGPITMTAGGAAAETALQAAVRAIDAGETAIALDALGRSDSAAVAVLVAVRRRAEERRQTLVFSGAPMSVVSLAKLYGVETLIHAS